MRVLFLRHTHYRMGLQHGRQVHDLRPMVLNSVNARLERLTRSGGLRPALVQQVEEVWDVHARSTMEMLKGISEELDIPLSRLFHYTLASYLEDRVSAESQSEGCTVWAASRSATYDGRPMLVKNRDYFEEHIPMRAVAYAVPEHGYRYLYITSAGSPAVFSSGMNERGLVVADTHVASRDLGPGLARFSLMMDLLEQQASVPDAIAYLRSVPCMGAGNLTLADAHGNLAVFENGYNRSGQVDATGDVVVATNHFVSESMRDQNLMRPDGSGAYDETFGRQATARALLQGAHGAIDLELAKRMARHHGPTALCRHRPLNASDTIAAAIYLPVQQQLLFCNGWPCQGSYETYRL